MSDLMTHSCGCVNTLDSCGVIRSYSKCDGHRSAQRDVGELGESYYRELVELDPECHMPDRIRQRYVDEFEECFGKLAPVEPKVVAYEIGAGLSPYVPIITGANYFYSAIEPSKWAGEWLGKEYVDTILHVFEGTWDDKQIGPPVYMILCAHSLEHMPDAPAALRKMYDALEPGGLLYIIVPDDSDPCNPDHLWFFNDGSLRSLLESIGFRVDTMEMRRRVPHENFIYCKAAKP